MDTFPFEFKIFDKTDVLVTHTDLNGVETELVLDSDYTVNANPDQDESPGGTVTYPVSGALLPDGEKVTLSGALSYDQPTDITNQGGFYPEVVEDALDRSAIQNQQLKEKLDRAVVVPISDERTPADYWQDLFVAADAAAQSATASAAAAASSEQAAASSEQAAASSEQSAALSESNAADSATAAALSEDNAANSEQAAALLEANAASSEQTASTAATTATTKASEAASSASSASSSASTAATKANEASDSAAAALASKNAAATSEANAAASAASVDPDNLVHKAGAVMTGDLTIPSLNGGPLAGMRNRIINGDFRINQATSAASFTLSAGQYGHDMWKAGASGCSYTVSTAANVTTVTITAGTLLQVVEGNTIFSGVHSLSWAGTAQGRINTGGYGASGNVTATLTGGVNATVEFGIGTVTAVQLEPGDYASIYEFRPYAIELTLCRRHYQNISELIYAVGICISSTQLRVAYQFRPMRAVPAVTFGGTFNVNATGALFTASSMNADLLGVSAGTGAFRILAQTTGLTNGHAGILGDQASSRIILDARL